MYRYAAKVMADCHSEAVSCPVHLAASGWAAWPGVDGRGWRGLINRVALHNEPLGPALLALAVDSRRASACACTLQQTRDYRRHRRRLCLCCLYSHLHAHALLGHVPANFSDPGY